METLNIIEANGFYVIKKEGKFGSLPVMCVDGEKVFPNGAEELVFKNRPQRITRVSKRTILDYVTVSGVKMSEAEELEIRNQFRYDFDEDGEKIFPSLEDEFSYRKHQASVERFYKEVEEEQEFALNFFKSVKSEYPEIVPLWTSGAESVECDLCHYYPTPLKYLKDIAEKYGKTVTVEKSSFGIKRDMDFTLPGHSTGSLEFLQYKGDYVSSAPWSNNKNFFHFVKYQKYEDCVKARNNHIEQIENVVRTIVKLEEQKELSKTKASEVFKELGQIISTLNKVDPKVATKQYLSMAIRNAKQLQQQLAD